MSVLYGLPMYKAIMIAELNRLLIGWMNYYRFSRSSWILSKLDSWIRRKSRCLRLKQLKRATTIVRFLLRSGVNRNNAWKLAGSSKGWWRMSGTLQSHLAMKVQCFEELGLVSLSSRWQMLQTAVNRRVAEQACPVV
jgi:RNA-directed DNA polymerase